ncbi:MAG TPA: MmcQ/YjbR family DNA-binding protein [Microlunatus sp.]
MTLLDMGAEQVGVPEDVVERVHRLCLALPEVTKRVDFSRVSTRSTAWSFDIRRRSFCLLVASEDTTGKPDTILVLRAEPGERDALLSIGHPYHTSPAGEDRIVVVINHDTDWDKTAELLTDSYRMLARRSSLPYSSSTSEPGDPRAR